MRVGSLSTSQDGLCRSNQTLALDANRPFLVDRARHVNVVHRLCSSIRSLQHIVIFQREQERTEAVIGHC